MGNDFEKPRKQIVKPESDGQRLKESLRASVNTSFDVSQYSSPADKIALFKSLFFGRQDVYALRWEGADGSSGYQPVCKNIWKKGICRKPQIKCSQCESREFAPLTDQVIYNHLSGRISVGIYPLLEDETCMFLAIDLDGDGWEEDAKAFSNVSSSLSIPLYIERSRSGNGCHLWLFFTDAIKASIARKLGFELLNKVLESRPRLGLGSYDRFFLIKICFQRAGLGI